MGVTIRLATAEDLDLLDTGLRALSASLGDEHLAGRETLARAGFGAHPAFQAMIAVEGAAVHGVAMFSPLFSTTRGSAGLYVSDLWVDDAARGSGLGRRLLAHAALHAAKAWDARFLRLMVYQGNEAAFGFYRRLGFTAETGDIVMTLDKAGLDALKGQT